MGRVGLVLVVMVALLGAGTAHAADVYLPTQTILDQYNAARAEWGLPPVVNDPAMTEGCHNDLAYRRIHGDTAEFHDETPGRAGYTEIGQRAAQRSNGGATFSDGVGNPSLTSPKHRAGYANPIPTKVGLAEVHWLSADNSPQTATCLWTSLYEDADLKPGRVVSDAPKAWFVPGTAPRRAWFYERAYEAPTIPAFDVGWTADPHELYVSGEHVLLYHDDLPEGALYEGCRSTILGPGGRAVPARLLNGDLIAPKDPYLPGATYRAIATFSQTEACTPLQRTAASSFTTEDRPGEDGLITLGAPQQRNGKWVADFHVDRMLMAVGQGRFDANFDNTCGQYSWDLEWYYHGPPVFDFTAFCAGKVTIVAQSRRLQLGSSCWSPFTVQRTYTVTRTGDTVTGVTAEAQQVTPTTPDPCSAPPTPGVPEPLTSAPGGVVRIAGVDPAQVTAVRFGGVAATHWDAADGAIDVTVPAGAPSGAVQVQTPTGIATATAGFTVAGPDTAAPDTRLDLGPADTGTPSTAQFWFSSTEGGGTFRCAVDGAAPQTCTPPLALQDLADGVHQVVITAVDAAGNADTTPSEASWRVGPGPAPGTEQPPVITPAPTTTAVTTPTAVTGPPAVRAVPRLTARGVQLRRKSGKLSLGTLVLPTRSRVKLTLSTTVRGRKVKLPGPTTTYRAGNVKLAVKLSRKTRAALKRVKRLKVRAVIVITPLPTGARTTLRRTLDVKVR